MIKFHYSLVANNLNHIENLIKVSDFEAERKKRDLREEFEILEEATFLKTHKKRMNIDPEVQ